MPAPHVSSAFGDLLDPRFQEIFESEKQYYELTEHVVQALQFRP
jgi:hypothetical protein